MANDVNQLTVTGRLGATPELLSTPSGTSVVRTRLAINRSMRGDDGKWTSSTDWVSLEIWGKTAEMFAANFAKGDHIFVVGAIRCSEWKDPSTQAKRTRTFVKVWRVNRIESKRTAKKTPAPAALGDDGDDDDLPL